MEKAKDLFLKAISISSQVFQHFYWLGKTYWQLGGEFQTNKKYAQTQFLQSAKLNPDFASNFTYLGHFYRLVEKDLEKAKRCYQKAISLDILDEEAGVYLSNLYIEAGQQSLAIALYRDVTDKSHLAGWAWFRLARYQQVHNFQYFSRV